jgi:hypothetical protein
MTNWLENLAGNWHYGAVSNMLYMHSMENVKIILDGKGTCRFHRKLHL